MSASLIGRLRSSAFRLGEPSRLPLNQMKLIRMGRRAVFQGPGQARALQSRPHGPGEWDPAHLEIWQKATKIA